MTTNPRIKHTIAGGWDPANYEYVTSFDSNAPIYETELVFTGLDFVVKVKTPLVLSWSGKIREQLGDSPDSEILTRGQCDHCGAHLRYIVVFRYTPDGTLIGVGNDCAEERFELPSRAAYDVKRLKELAAGGREKLRIAEQLNAWSADNPGVAQFFSNYQAEYDAGTRHYSDNFVLDVGRKLPQYGSLSERQVDAIGKAFRRDGEKERERLVRELSTGPKSEFPEGKRVLVTGKIVSLKTQDSDYGLQYKMLIESDFGWKVWLTKPNAIADAEVGDTVTFNADLTVSRDDKYFGFGKRPTRAKILRRGS